MSTGTVKFFNVAKGFGFVTPDDGGADLFLPAAAVTAAGVTAVNPGQRIRFEQAPDTKGPKVVSLKLVGEAPAKASLPAGERVTIYCDTSTDVAADMAEAARGSGFSVMMQDYLTAPPGADQLKRLSQILSASGQSLVRRYDPLFLALRLDDRFITDQDFWTAIVEHPVLINGPVLATSGRARICKTVDEARSFLRKDEATSSPKPKTLSPRIAAMLRGEAPPSDEPAAPVESPPPAPAPSPEKKARAGTKAVAKSKVTTKPKPKIAVKAAPEKTSKKKAALKKAPKPAQKKAKKRART